MEWPLAVLVIMGSLLVLFASGLPVAFAFLIITVVGAFLWLGGTAGLHMLTLDIRASLGNFCLLPIPMFILMGEVMFHSGMGVRIIDTVDKWLGRLPGRLGVLAVASGTLLATLSGVSVATTALLGATLVPELKRRGYQKPMSLGPILGSGGLAIMIPPSSLAVLLGAIGEISVGALLIAIIIPGLAMATLYTTYIIVRCLLQPSLAPPYEVSPTPLLEKVRATVRYVLPLSIIVFLVVGVIFVGIATPTEAAATGAIGTFLLGFSYGKLKWETVKKAIWGTAHLTVMMLMIIAVAEAFSHILGASGAGRGLVQFTVNLPLAPIFILVAMQVLVLFMGMFLDVGSIIMITAPLFMPIVRSLGFSDVWFGVIMLLNIEMAMTTPPFGLGLITMKGVAPPDTTMEDCYKAALPFLYCDATVMVLLIAFPPLALWLPGIMH